MTTDMTSVPTVPRCVDDPWTTKDDPPLAYKAYNETSPTYRTFPLNVTVGGATGTANYSSLEGSTQYEWFEILIPIICFLGMVGNVLNLLVLTRRRMLSNMDCLERSATHGMVALACSDMLFCLCVFPHAFVTQSRYVVSAARLFDVYYRAYGIALINLFLMISTWLIVMLAVSRYLVVVYPLKVRYLLTVTKTAVVIAMTYICSLVITLPHFAHVAVRPCVTYDGRLAHEVRSIQVTPLAHQLKFYIRWIWPILADFIPLFILLFCNTRLISELRKAKIQRRTSAPHHHSKDSHNKVNLTLVIIVLMLLLFVSPSEIIRYINPYTSWGDIGRVVASVTNVLQAVNFAVNFVLYCAVNTHFRRTMWDLLCCNSHERSPSLRTSHRSIYRSATEHERRLLNHGNGHVMVTHTNGAKPRLSDTGTICLDENAV